MNWGKISEKSVGNNIRITANVVLEHSGPIQVVKKKRFCCAASVSRATFEREIR